MAPSIIVKMYTKIYSKHFLSFLLFIIVTIIPKTEKTERQELTTNIKRRMIPKEESSMFRKLPEI